MGQHWLIIKHNQRKSMKKTLDDLQHLFEVELVGHALYKVWLLKSSSPYGLDHSYRPSLDLIIGTPSHHLELAWPGQGI